MQGRIGEALYYDKLTLRVDPYFQVLSLLKLFSLHALMNQLYSNHYNYQLPFKLIKQGLQTSNYSKASQFHIKVINQAINLST
jgi:hypothetical protein